MNDINQLDSDDSVSLEENSIAEDNSQKEHQSELPLGDSIPVDNSSFITEKEESKLIVLIGPTSSGKTTLIKSIYQQFQYGSIDNYYFAGSKSFLAFEQRAYWSRLQSGKSIPDTPKTRRGVNDLLHLRIWNSINNKFSNLLLSDFSGEDFTSVIANTDYAQSDFDVVKGAWNISFILDGDLISRLDKRQSTLKDAIELFRTFMYSNLIGQYVHITVIISKYDIVMERYKIDPNLEAFESHIKKQFNAIAIQFNRFIDFQKVTVMEDNEIGLDTHNMIKDVFENMVRDCRQNLGVDSKLQEQFVSQANCFSQRIKVTI